MSFLIIMAIKKEQDRYIQEKEKDLDKKSLQEQGIVKVLSASASVAIVFINFVLLRVIRAFAEFEKHETYTDLNTSVAFKLTIARFLNSSLIIFILNFSE